MDVEVIHHDNSDGTMPHPLTSNAYGVVCLAHMYDPSTLLLGYRYGIFPWDTYHDLGVYYFPHKRYLINPREIKIPKSIRSFFNQKKFYITVDTCFHEVINRCKSIRRKDGYATWITDDFVSVYGKLHEQGYAHSIEVWQDGLLVGGLYGIAVGKIFTGESMFGLVSNAARFAMISLAQLLVQKDFYMIDCQVINPYLQSFGGIEIDSIDFYYMMSHNLMEADDVGKWYPE